MWLNAGSLELTGQNPRPLDFQDVTLVSLTASLEALLYPKSQWAVYFSRGVMEAPCQFPH